MAATVTNIRDTAPAHLSDEARTVWRNVMDSYGIGDPAGRLLLQSALEAFDVVRDCQQRIAKDGRTVKGSTRQLVAHPLCSVERDARSQMHQALKLLRLDIPLEAP